MNIDVLLARCDFQHPFFARFILDKYGDIRETHPETARTIESQVFTPRFLTQILEGENPYLKASALKKVPASCFIPLVGPLLDHVCQDPALLGNAGHILGAIAPEQYQGVLESQSRKSLASMPVCPKNFSWLAYLPEMAAPLARELVEEGISLFEAHKDHPVCLAQEAGLVERLLSAAILTEHPWSLTGAALFIENLACRHKGEDQVNSVFDLFMRLAPVFDGSTFEVDLIREMEPDLENGRQPVIPPVLDRFYDGLDNIVTSLAGLGLGTGWSSLPFSRQTDTFFQGRLIRQITADPKIRECLEQAGLAREAGLAFVALLWRMSRKPVPDDISDQDLVAFLGLDSRPLPFMDRVWACLEQLAPDSRDRLFAQAFDQALGKIEKEGRGCQAMTNVLELIGPHPGFLPCFVKALLWDEKDFEGDFYDLVEDSLSQFGDAVFPLLEPVFDDIPDDRLGEVLNLIRRVGTPAAEAFLLKHFEAFMDWHKADTLEACQSLGSRAALNRVAHKAGKNQPGIDELYVLVNTYDGTAGPETERLLAGLRPRELAREETLAMLASDNPLPVLDLELRCSLCRDVSTYPCRRVVASPDGRAYVAQELVCISCGKVSELDVTATGEILIQMEMMRTMGKDGDLPAQGAVSLIRSHAMGKAMSVSEAVALYKEKIAKHPRNVDHYISLGTIYRTMSQPTFARIQYEKALDLGPFYIEAYLGLAKLEKAGDNPAAALEWLEKGRRYLGRPVMGKDVPADQILDEFRNLHLEMGRAAGIQVMPLKPEEFRAAGKSLTKVGPNEPCPCGSGKKFKKCCRIKA